MESNKMSLDKQDMESKEDITGIINFLRFRSKW